MSYLARAPLWGIDSKANDASHRHESAEFTNNVTEVAA